MGHRTTVSRGGLLWRFVAGSVAAFVATGVGVSLVMAGQLRDRGEAIAAFHAQFVTEALVQPLLEPADLARPITGSRYAELRDLVQARILSDGRDVRVKLWGPDGTILFSDVEDLVGRRFSPEQELRRAFAGHATIGVSDLDEPENVYERGLADKLFETYVPIRLSEGGRVAAVFEIYQDYSAIQADVSRNLRSFGVAFAGGLLLLYAALLPLVLRAARDLRRQNAELREAEAMYRTLVEELPAVTYRDSVLDGDPENLVPVYISPQIETLLGYTQEEWLSRPDLWDEVVHSEDVTRVRAHVERARAEGAPFGIEYRMNARDGRVVWVSEQSVLVTDESGRPRYWQGVLYDITGRKEAEEELRSSYEMLRRTDAERRRLLSRLVSAQEEERQRIAGDIHDDPIQKMTAVGLRLEALRRSLSDPDQSGVLGELEETVRSSVDRLRNFLFELHPHSLDAGGLADALHEYVSQLGREEDLRYEFENRLVSEPPVEIRTIAYRIAQEALNNARKHANANRVAVLLEGRDGGLFTRIQDDGVGFAPGDIDQPQPGHLGLTTMRERAEMAGGWCRVDGRPGAGTSVEFWLPFDQVEAGTTDERAPRPAAPPAPRRRSGGRSASGSPSDASSEAGV